jgi:hypothetical protein
MAQRRGGSAAKMDDRLHRPPPEQGHTGLGAFDAGTEANHLWAALAVKVHKNDARNMGERQKAVATGCG